MDEITKNIYDSWLECYNNINFLSQDITIKEIHLPGNLVNAASGSDSIMKHSYFIEDATNVTIYVDKKFNHLILNRCNDINLIFNEDLISGLDIFHSNDVNITYANGTSTIVSSINFGRSFNIYLLGPDAINCDLSVICTICVNGMNFIVHSTNYTMYENLFRANPLYFFMKMNSENDNLTIITIDSEYGVVDLQTINDKSGAKQPL